MTNVSSDCLIDTNLLIYLHDPREPARQQRAQIIMRQLIEQGRAVLSTQAVAEFANVGLRKLNTVLIPSELVAALGNIANSFRVIPYDAHVVIEACEATIQHQLHFWDAMIWALARQSQVAVILTEDAPHGRVLGGVQYINPFSPEFDPAEIGITIA